MHIYGMFVQFFRVGELSNLLLIHIKPFSLGPLERRERGGPKLSRASDTCSPKHSEQRAFSAIKDTQAAHWGARDWWLSIGVRSTGIVPYFPVLRHKSKLTNRIHPLKTLVHHQEFYPVT